MSRSQAGPIHVRPRTEIEGFFLTAASTPSGPGISDVLRSGVGTAGEILDTAPPATSSPAKTSPTAGG